MIPMVLSSEVGEHGTIQITIFLQGNIVFECLILGFTNKKKIKKYCIDFEIIISEYSWLSKICKPKSKLNERNAWAKAQYIKSE